MPSRSRAHRHLVQPSDPSLYRPGREPQPVAEQGVSGLGLPARRDGHESVSGHDQHAHGHQSLFQSRLLDFSDDVAGDPQAGHLVHRLFRRSHGIRFPPRRRIGILASFAFVGALWLTFLLFPPFNFVYGLQGWLATNPPYGHTLALSNLILVAFIRIGVESPTAAGPGRRLARHWLLASCIVLLLLLIVLAAPFYNGGMLVGTFLLTGVIFLSSQSVSQMLWRLAAGVYVLACCAALGFAGFFAGAQAYSAGFSGLDRAPLQFHWPAEFSSELIAGARQGLCAWGVVCERMAQWPLALTGSYWLQLSIIVGAIAVAVRTRPPLARIGALFAVLWIVLLVAWIAASLGIVAAPPLSAPYFYLMMYPFWAFFSLYSGVFLIELVTARLPPR